MAGAMASAQMNNAVDGVEHIIGYVFKDRFLLWEALQAAGSSVLQAGNRTIPNGNKRLALLGDTILQLVLVEQWYAGGQARDTSDGSPVVFDRDRQRVGSNNNLNTLGIQAGLDFFVNLAGGTTVVSPVTMSATVEAILGAVYLDGGLQAVTPVMQALGL
ncbi:MAG: hypothetical protein Q9171_003842 [Xanthocarpia ochracea]